MQASKLIIGESSNSFADYTSEAISRLEKFRIRDEEGEICEEQVQINDHLQKDEMLALEAIFGDDVFAFRKIDGLRCFQVHVHAKLPDGFAVYAKLGSFIHNIENRSESNDFSYTFEVRHLPPIILICSLPLSYPSHHPPHFTMYVQWLNTKKISNLCCMLDNIWNEQPRQEVLYQWVEWLRDSSVSYLGFNDGISLIFNNILNIVDDRAISGILSLENNIASLVKYNDEKSKEAFLADVHQCSICYEEYAGTNFIKLSCGHFFCLECMKTYSNIHLIEGTVMKLKCPDAKCKELILPNVLKRLLGTESYQRWESVILQKTLDSMPDVVACPRCEIACLEDEENFAQCSNCFFSFCSLCKERRHVGSTCMKIRRKLLMLQECETSSDMRNEQKRKMQNLINDFLSLKEVYRTSRLCPACKVPISRTEGCNKMVCRNCGNFFCYRCNKIINGYEHFWNNCKLFDNGAVMNPEIMMYQQAMLSHIQAQDDPKLLESHPCPNCRQMSGKVNSNNDNQMTCMICSNCYCVICLKNIRNSGHPVDACPQLLEESHLVVSTQSNQ